MPQGFQSILPASQELARLLRELKSGGHRALIFTQMARMLDVLEVFLNLHGYIYLRLDGSTKPEQRQVREQLDRSSGNWSIVLLGNAFPP